MNRKPARKSRAIVSSLALGVAFLALWVFGSNFVLKVVRMMEMPVTEHAAMEVSVPVAIPDSPRETPFSVVAQTNLPSEPAVAEPVVAQRVRPNSVVWDPFAPKPVKSIVAVDRPTSSDQSISLPLRGAQKPVAREPVAADRVALEQTKPTPSDDPLVAKREAQPSSTPSVESTPVASEPLVPNPVRTVAAEGRATPSPTARVVVASADAGIGSRWPDRWPGRVIARAVEPVADETPEQPSSVPFPRTRPHIVSVPLPAPRPGIRTRQRSAASRVLTEADVRIQAVHF